MGSAPAEGSPGSVPFRKSERQGSQIVSWWIGLIAGSAGGNVANGGLSALVGALLPLIISFLKKPAA